MSQRTVIMELEVKKSIKITQFLPFSHPKQPFMYLYPSFFYFFFIVPQTL